MTTRTRAIHRSFAPTPALAVGLALALLLAIVVIAPAASATSEESVTTLAYREKVKLAAGAWLTETETTSSDFTIRVFYKTTWSTGEGKIRYADPQVILFCTHRELDTATNLTTRTEYEGFAAAAGSTFIFSRARGRARVVAGAPSMDINASKKTLWSGPKVRPNATRSSRSAYRSRSTASEPARSAGCGRRR
ncbi:MAG: hypothetical protein OEM97_09720 [Acidimicrobiia bacterium]|nr:hypothetical protein [Acidimicrobiia bacterium]